MKDVVYKLAGKAARESVAALGESAPWHARPKLVAMLENMSELGVEIRVRKAQRKRSDAANNYYWFALGLFAKATGLSPDEAHTAVLAEHHGADEVKLGKRTYYVPKGRSHNLTTEEFSELIATLHRVAAFCGVVLPDPSEVA